jgi:hypothetical protein
MLFLTLDLYELFGFIFCHFILGTAFSPEHESYLLRSEWFVLSDYEKCPDMNH